MLKNEQGSQSSGEARGPFVIAALEWGPALAILSPDRSQIDWSNGTYWAPCPSKPTPQPVNLTGRWIALDGGCVVHQQGNLVKSGNTKDCLAAGSMDEKGHLILDGFVGRFEGDVTADGNHINWIDGSYWTRAEVYGLEDKQR